MQIIRDKTAIVGVGASPQGKLPGSSALSLAVEAFVNERGHDTRGDVPAHALGTYLLFFGER